MAIFAAVSRDGGRTFSPRARVDGARGQSPAHPRVAIGADDRPIVVWDETARDSRQIAMYIDGRVNVLSNEKAASYPALAVTGSGILVAWTSQSNGSSRVRSVRIEIATASAGQATSVTCNVPPLQRHQAALRPVARLGDECSTGKSVSRDARRDERGKGAGGAPPPARGATG
jgi:hypothetical protein